MEHYKNRRIVLASRPVGAPTKDDFRLEESATPVPKEGEVLLRSIYLSLDPYMRGRMNDAPSYAPPVAIDEVMVGAGKIHYREQVVDGLESGPEAFIGMPEGQNFGKLVVKVNNTM